MGFNIVARGQEDANKSLPVAEATELMKAAVESYSADGHDMSEVVSEEAQASLAKEYALLVVCTFSFATM